MLFSYKAVRTDGRVEEGMREAADKQALAHELSIGGETPIHIEEVKAKKKGINISLFDHISTEEKIVFAKNLSVMLKAGLPLTRALAVIDRESKNKKLKKIVIGIVAAINKGTPFTEALKAYPKVFSVLFISLTHAGEESGKLSDALATAAFQMARSDSVAKKVRGAMLYPSVIITLMAAVGVVMMVFVVPQLVTTFDSLKVALPFETVLIIDVSNILTHDGLWILIGLAVLVFLVISFKKTKRGTRFFNWLSLHTPFVKTVVVENASARFARTLGSLLSSGVEMIEALKITEDVVGNTYFRDVIREAEEQIQKGSVLSKVLMDHEKIFPAYLGETASVGEETGDLAGMLLSVAQSYEDSVEEKMKNISTIIEPVLLVTVGIGVGFFAIAVISPIYSLVNDF
jgi:type IV pilus assembly protein PilC